MDNNQTKRRGRPRKKDQTKKTRYSTKKKHYDENKKTYFKIYRRGQNNIQQKVNNSENDRNIIPQNRNIKQNKQINALQQENNILNISLQNVENNYDDDKSCLLGKNFDTLLLCFQMHVKDKVPITNIPQCINRIYNFIMPNFKASLWQGRTLQYYFRYRLGILNIMHVSFIVSTTPSFF